MSRLRLQYAKDEIITDLYTYGNEWMYEDTTPYVGSYHRYTTREVYTGTVWSNSQSKKLIPYYDTSLLSYRYKQLNQNVQTSYNSFNHYLVELAYDDYSKGYITRYFIKKLNDNSITEISKLTYDDYNGYLIDQHLYKAIKIKWIISGVPQTIYKDGITTVSVAEQNRNMLISTEQKFPGISTKLNNLLEFYTNTKFNVPADIN